ncbi:MAG: hypothetical protein HRU19_05370 [Pseudobacteriovorax sp.]|nr:hypothetical protein [Pseudobacteriovorax sp.]
MFFGKKTLLLAFSLLVSACRSDPVDSHTGVRGSHDKSSRETLRLPLLVSSPLGLSSGISDMVIAVGNCRSGYSAELKVLSPDIEMYRFDRDCLASINSFTINGAEFTAKLPFDTGERAKNIFSSKTGDEAQVIVVSQLSSPLKDSDQISFSIRLLDNEDDVVIDNLANVIAIEVDQPLVHDGIHHCI